MFTSDVMFTIQTDGRSIQHVNWCSTHPSMLQWYKQLLVAVYEDSIIRYTTGSIERNRPGYTGRAEQAGVPRNLLLDT